MRSIPVVGWLAAFGCAEYSVQKENAELAGVKGNSDGGSDGSATTDADTAVNAETATYFSVDGGVVLVDGVADPAQSTLTLGFWARDATLLCDAERAVTGLSELPTDDGSRMLAWWEATLAPAGECRGYGDPPVLRLGIGPYDPLLDPAMVEAGFSPDAGYGLYVQESATGPTYLFGVAGTEEVLAGDTLPVEAGPLPEGSYALHGLHLLPLW